MKAYLALLALLLCSFLATIVTPASAADGGKGTTEGTFVGIEQGDYTHLEIKNKKGKSESFIVLEVDETLQKFIDNPAKMKGAAVVVEWKEELIPEAGEKLKVIAKLTRKKE